MRILALDLGDVWTGIAISDPTAMLARPLETAKTLVDLESQLVKIIVQHGVQEIVCGLPLDQRGGRGLQAEKTIKLVEQLKKIVTKSETNAISFVLWDERRSSKIASQTMKENSSNGNKKREHAVAAAFILQNYLDFRRQSLAVE